MSRRRPVVAGNWKMHKTVSEAISFARDLAQEVSAEVEAEVIVSPPFTALADVCRVLADGPVSVAAQNVRWGRRTGEHGGSNGSAGYCWRPRRWGEFGRGILPGDYRSLREKHKWG